MGRLTDVMIRTPKAEIEVRSLPTGGQTQVIIWDGGAYSYATLDRDGTAELIKGLAAAYYKLHGHWPELK